MARTGGSAPAAMIKGIVISWFVTMAVFFIYAMLITYTDMSEKHIATVALVTTALSCMLCGFITARCAKSRGLLWGVLSGGIYMLVLLGAAFAAIPNFAPSPKFAITLALALTGGGLGGIAGINIRR